MDVRIEYDRQANTVYVEVNEGEHARTIEVEPHRIYVDVGDDGRTLGIEFLSWDIFEQYIEEHGELNLPQRFSGPQSLAPT